ncbi:MAG: chemotaxis protein CheC [Candidatus Hydrothermarchaeales archaeon]
MRERMKLTDFEMDSLKEVGSIGASHAATALSKMANRRIDISVPGLKLIPIEKFLEEVGGSESLVAGIYAKVQGDLCGGMLSVFPMKAALTLVDILMERPLGSSETLSEMDSSALIEVGNILTSTFIGAMSDFLDLNIFPTPPGLACDMAGSLLEFLVIEMGEHADNAILFQTHLSMSPTMVEGQLFLCIDPSSLDKIFEKIREKVGL